MKTTILTIITLLIGTIAISQSYQYKPAEQYYYKPKVYQGGESYEYQPIEMPEVKTNTITISNKSREARVVYIYFKNQTTFEWEYLQSSRIPGGETVSYQIGQYEYTFQYGYKVESSYQTTITAFGNYPVSIY